MMGRVEEFSRDGKDFVCIDLSGLKDNDIFVEVTKDIEAVIAKHPPKSVYTITNVEDIRFDTSSKKLISAYMEHNAPYVKCGAVIGLDGVKKMFVNAVMQMSGRKNMHFAYTKESAIEWLLQQD